MHVVIMGCGRVGSTLAHALQARGHEVAVIDMDVEAFRRLGPDFTGRTIKGVGFDRGVLINAGIQTAGAFAAVSNGDNSNILAARVVREQFGVGNVVARIYDADRAEVYEKLGIPTVASVRWTAGQVLNVLLPDDAAPEWRDPSGFTGLVQVPFSPAWVGTPLGRIETVIGARIPFLSRLGRGQCPPPGTILQADDTIWVAVESKRMGAVQEILAGQPVRQ